MNITDIPKITPKAARVNAGYTQKQAAKKLGISQTSLQSYESGTTTPRWDVIDGMERLYGYPSSLIDFSKNSLKANGRAS